MNLDSIDIEIVPSVSLIEKNEEIRFKTKDDGLNVALAIMEDQDVSITIIKDIQLWPVRTDDAYLVPLKKELIIDKINLSYNKEGDCECFMIDPTDSPHKIPFFLYNKNNKKNIIFTSSHDKYTASTLSTSLPDVNFFYNKDHFQSDKWSCGIFGAYDIVDIYRQYKEDPDLKYSASCNTNYNPINMNATYRKRSQLSKTRNPDNTEDNIIVDFEKNNLSYKKIDGHTKQANIWNIWSLVDLHINKAINLTDESLELLTKHGFVYKDKHDKINKVNVHARNAFIESYHRSIEKLSDKHKKTMQYIKQNPEDINFSKQLDYLNKNATSLKKISPLGNIHLLWAKRESRKKTPNTYRL